MLFFRIIVMLLLINVCQFGNAEERVLIEMHSGKRIRAHTISTDASFPQHVVVGIGNDRIQIQRVLPWNRVKSVYASATVAVDLKVPDGVQVKDIAELPKQAPPLKRLESSDQYEPTIGTSPTLPIPPSPASNPPLPDHLPPPVEPFRFDCEPPVRYSEISVPFDGCGFALFPGPCGWRDPGIVVGVRNQDGTPYPADANAGSLRQKGADRADPLRAADFQGKSTGEPRELLTSVRAFNRNGLADWNSLEVSFQGRNAAGQSCQVRGSLKCTLWSRRARLVRAYAETFFEEPGELVRVGSWSQFVDSASADATGIQKIVLALPPSPADHNLRTSQFGVLAVELDIPGQGRLATTSAPVSLRQVGPVRDRSVVDFGESILPGQSVSEGGSNSGNWPAPLSGLRPDSRRFIIQP